MNPEKMGKTLESRSRVFAVVLIVTTLFPSVFPRLVPPNPGKSSYQPAYSPSYVSAPSYQRYSPAPSYPAQSYQPGPSYHFPALPYALNYSPAPSYQQSYSPAPSYQPVYEPSYAPSYQPTYEPSYTPSYEPSYAPSYQPTYEPSYAPSYSPAPSYQPVYAPSYSPAPSYQPSYSPMPSYKPTYEPSYTPSYEPSYTPSYQPTYEPSYPMSYTPSYNPPTYQPSYQHTYSPKPTYQEHDNYDVHFRELNVSSHCGVIPATNDELYQASKDVAPYGKYPWVVQITDEYNNFVCQGVVIQHRFILTASSCIYGSMDQYRVRIADWDVLTNYNEYEAYKNTDFKICNSFPVSYDAASSSYAYGGAESKLLILEIDAGRYLNDKYPSYHHVCLPTYSHPQPSYNPPQYQPSYNPTPSYKSSYNPAPYSYKPSYTPSDSHPYLECWVVGWYASKTSELQNHPPPSEEESYGGHQPLQSYHRSNSNYQEEEYYNYYDESKIQRRAKVKKVKCPSYRYEKKSSYKYGYSPKQSYGYGYTSYKEDEDVCFVGVEGYDACVADKGAAIFCLVPDKSGYDAGSYAGSYHQSSYAKGYGPSSKGYQQYDGSYDESIPAAPAPNAESRQRAVLYAIVQAPTKCHPDRCMKKPYYHYDSRRSKNYSKKQRPLKATLVDEKVGESIYKISSSSQSYSKHSYC